MAGRLVAEEHAEEEEEGGQGLQRDGHDPDGVAGDVEKGGVVDPEADHDAGYDRELVEAGEGAADGAGGILGNVERDGDRGHAYAETGCYPGGWV